MDLLTTILLFIVVFSVITVSHEYGHFLLARLRGIRVSEFTIGIGPKLVGIRKNGTDFCIRLLPFGGACIYEGEEDSLPDNSKGQEEIETKSDSVECDEADGGFIKEKQGIAFTKAPVLSRIAVVFAGPFFNFVLAYILSLIVVWFAGSSKPVIGDVMKGYPAEKAGIKAGDEIISMNGSRVHIGDEISINVFLNGKNDMTLEYLRDGKKYKATITPQYNKEDNSYYLGLMNFEKPIDCRNISVIPYAFYEVRFAAVNTIKSLIILVSGKGSKDDLGGPVAVATVVDEVKDSAAPYGIFTLILNMMSLATLLSVNLGIVNLLPLPALDGGRLLFMLVELIRGKPIDPEKEGAVHLVGIALLIGLMVFVTYNDIVRAITG